MLVSAIMPTRGRPKLTLDAIRCVLLQDYPDRELVILDDDDTPPSVPDYPPAFVAAWEAAPFDVRYFRLPRMTIAQKRNWLVREAKGEVIVHFDSDDWSAPDRISNQVALLNEYPSKPLVGYHSILFWSHLLDKGYRWDGHDGFPCGASMCYRRQFVLDHPFPEGKPTTEPPGKTHGEDTAMVKIAKTYGPGAIPTSDGATRLVARCHNDNTSSAARVGRNGWPEARRSEFPTAFFAGISPLT